MTTTLMHTTRIAVQIIINDDAGQFTQFVTALTTLIGLMLTAAAWVKPIVIFAADVVEAADFTLKVFNIGVNALVFGLGVRI